MIKFFFTNKNMAFGDWLKEKRKRAGLSQGRLAALATANGHSVTSAYISNIERGYDKNKKGVPGRPNELLVIALAKALDIDPDDALNEAGYRSKKAAIPEPIAAIGFDWTNEEDEQKIAEYMQFLKSQKEQKPAFKQFHRKPGAPSMKTAIIAEEKEEKRKER